MLPSYPEFEPIALRHQEDISRLLAEEQPDTSELTFTNLFIWRQHYRYRVAQCEGSLLVVGQRPGCEPFFLPPVGPTAPGVCRRILSEGTGVLSIRRASQHFLTRCGFSAGEFAVSEEEGQADYVYLAQDLVRLAGNRYDGKRNHLKRFRRLYRWEYRPLSVELLPGCYALEEDWCQARACPRELGLEAERVAIWEALDNFGRLGYVGGAILVEGRVQAFSLGEGLNADTAVIHIEKASPEFQGIYQAINQQFLERELAQSFEFVNREQDLNDAGLRRAKLSYHPHHLVPKYMIHHAG